VVAVIRYAHRVGDAIDERELFVQGPVVIFKWRNAAGWPVEYASANAVEVFGHGADDFVSGRVSYGAVLHPDDAPRVAREVEVGTASGARGWAHEHYRVLHKDGSVRWLYDYTRVVRDAAGAVTHYLGYVIDISERIAAEDEARELERRLLHAQKLESLGLLAGGVAHDFNNLLTGILGQASLARQQLATVPSEFRRALDQIEGLARRASGLTRQLLAYSGKGRFVIEPIELGAVVRELAPMFGVIVPKAAQLVVEVDPGATVIMGDRSQIEQVVMNLITNAAEALDDAPAAASACRRCSASSAPTTGGSRSPAAPATAPASASSVRRSTSRSRPRRPRRPRRRAAPAARSWWSTTRRRSAPACRRSSATSATRSSRPPTARPRSRSSSAGCRSPRRWST
jgi:PAS domain S-box-containing protein